MLVISILLSFMYFCTPTVNAAETPACTDTAYTASARQAMPSEECIASSPAAIYNNMATTGHNLTLDGKNDNLIPHAPILRRDIEKYPPTHTGRNAESPPHTTDKTGYYVIALRKIVV